MSILLYELVGSDRERPFSPHCWKARMALKHKGLDFELAQVPFTGIAAIEGGASRIVPLLKDGETLVADSFKIAEYLEAAYPDRPSLFGGAGGIALSRFVESWTQRVVHPAVTGFAIMDIHDLLDEPDRRYFRDSRQGRLGKSLEAVAAGREERVGGFLQTIEPLRALLAQQSFIGGDGPLFADHIVFGAFQWLRVVSPLAVLPGDDPVAAWLERCLDLYEGHGRTARAAA